MHLNSPSIQKFSPHQANTTSYKDATLYCHGLTKQYNNNDGVHGLDLEIPQGCELGIIGPNGAGKSTKLKLMMGLLKPDSGDLNILGEPHPYQSTALRQRIGYVPEHHHIYPWMKIHEVIQFTKSFYNNWNEEICTDLIGKYNLALDKRVIELSHGMLTKLALILALTHEPELLILGEPTTGLDPIIREEFLEGVLHPIFENSGRTMVFSSHIMSDIESVSDTIAIVNNGRLLACSPKKTLLIQTKRIILSQCEKLELPPALGTIIFKQQEGSASIITLSGCNEKTIDFFQNHKHIQIQAIQDLSLELIFKDYIRGARSCK